MSALGKRLKQARERRGLTQTDLAAAAGLASDVSVSRYEREVTQPSGDTLQRLARALDCSIDWLLTGRGAV